MSREVSRARLHLLRAVYLANAAIIGFGAGAELIRQRTLIHGGGAWDLVYGVAFSLYAAYAVLLLLGVRFPLKLLPLLLLQITYKSIWLIAIGYPLYSAGRLTPAALGSVKFFASIVVVDLLVIPWPYVFDHYVRAIFKLDAERASPSKEQATAPRASVGT